MFFTESDKVQIGGLILDLKEANADAKREHNKLARDVVAYHNEQEEELVSLRKDVTTLQADLTELTKRLGYEVFDIPARPGVRVLEKRD